MNQKACFSTILSLCLAITLSACSNRTQPTQTSEISDVISTPSGTDATGKNTADPIANDPLNSGTLDKMEDDGNPSPVDLLERMRRGFELPELNSKHIAQYEKWSTEHESYLSNLFERGTPFLFHIVEEIEKRKLPMELALLPAIESAYKPTAVSHSRAGGLWQFIPSTGRHFGLRQDWWYDGRRDLLTSTDAALDYLTQLNEMFDGDWFLTLAAYNAGPGTVSRAVKYNKRKRKGTHYQDLSLRLETRRYVPKLIALKNVVNNPDKFGIELPIIESKPYFEVVELNGQIDLKKFANDAGIEQSELRHLNAGFKRWATSPKGPHRLLIPINENGDVEHAKLAVQRAPQINYSNHKIAHGDSLSSIARKYGVSVKALQTSNNLRGTRIRAGKNLLIPIRAENATLVAATSEAQRTDTSSDKRLMHQVKRGDTLWSIARKYNVRLSNLLSWNNISKNQILQLNQTLLVMTN